MESFLGLQIGWGKTNPPFTPTDLGSKAHRKRSKSNSTVSLSILDKCERVAHIEKRIRVEGKTHRKEKQNES